jgi:hypothetical protein
MRQVNRLRQRGVVLLLLLLVVFTLGSTVLLATLNTQQNVQREEQKALIAQLQIAKENLLAFAAYSNQFYATDYFAAGSRGPGFFPCPDTDNDGFPQLSCNASGTQPVVGRLPARFRSTGPDIEFNDYYSDIDQQFWYAVAPRFIYHSSNASNRRANQRTTSGITNRLTLDGAPNYVALLIVPGDAMNNQNRSLDANRNVSSHYIESQGTGSNRRIFTSAVFNPPGTNDLIVGITHDEYMKAVGYTVAHQIKTKLDSSGYPVSGLTGSPPAPSQSAFRSLFPNSAVTFTWFRNTNSSPATGERWPWGIAYERLSSSSATLVFSGCTNMIFTVSSSGINRSADSCTP